MKKVILFIALWLVGAGATVVMASWGPNFPRENDNPAGYANISVENQSGEMIGKPILVYGAEFDSSTETFVAEVYDGTSSTAIENTAASIESADSIQVNVPNYHTVTKTYTPPLQFYNGAYVNIDTGSGKVRLFYR